jgi:hypothetical protein
MRKAGSEAKIPLVEAQATAATCKRLCVADGPRITTLHTRSLEAAIWLSRCTYSRSTNPTSFAVCTYVLVTHKFFSKTCYCTEKVVQIFFESEIPNWHPQCVLQFWHRCTRGAIAEARAIIQKSQSGSPVLRPIFSPGVYFICPGALSNSTVRDSY